MATESNILIVFHLARPVHLHDLIIVTYGVFIQDRCELVNLKLFTFNEDMLTMYTNNTIKCFIILSNTCMRSPCMGCVLDNVDIHFIPLQGWS